LANFSAILLGIFLPKRTERVLPLATTTLAPEAATAKTTKTTKTAAKRSRACASRLCSE
jgi:hypothetical protein